MHAAYNVWCVADRPDRAVKTIRDELLSGGIFKCAVGFVTWVDLLCLRLMLFNQGKGCGVI